MDLDTDPMDLEITPSGQACGATVRGIDLTIALDPTQVASIRAAWLEHKVLAFPDQPLDDDGLEAFALNFGPHGVDPYFQAVDGHRSIAAIHRAAAETAPIFAESWHADWTFQEFPPDGTCLHARIIPPHGGNTEFADQQAVYQALPADLRTWADEAVVVHSARSGYAPDGLYGDDDTEPRAMKIVSSATAYDTQTHRLVREHPETGVRTLYGCVGYIIGVEGGALASATLGSGDLDEGQARLLEIFDWQRKPEFHYVHEWGQDMLTMWDNRCVLHRATAGYDGHERLLHRMTIGYNPAAGAP